VRIQEHEVECLERETPAPPPGPAKQLLSVDGAFIPLVGGEWAEVKTLVIGEVLPPLQRDGEVRAVTDGAEWIQAFVSFHRSDALRIPDFPHAAERITQIGQAK